MSGGSRPALRGFTLLEVLVAVAILGLGLTMILSSQVGLFSSAARSQHLTVATNLARCKMTELELELLQKGYPMLDLSDEGHCCADQAEDGYRCATKVERIELPQPDALSSDPDAEGSDGLMDVLSKLQSPEGMGSKEPGSLQDLAKDIGESASASGLGPMVMGIVYPSLKPLLEASIRRVTVTVQWKEGVRARELSVTQFVTDPQQGGLDETEVPQDEAASGTASPFGAGLGANPPRFPGFGGP